MTTSWLGVRKDTSFFHWVGVKIHALHSASADMGRNALLLLGRGRNLDF